ncbi:DUF3592 domain-containing protein [Streptomyces sp. NPDC098781]|uniref:DUF3592 domain-containing protein n=1 Tax=Streptomyces sp. NPDC098781 TaxID=3366097 RepID=UPI0037F8C99A
MTGETVGVVLCVLAGALCLWAGVREYRLIRRLVRHGVHAEGVVVDRERSSSEDPWTPVIEYTDRQGRRVRFRPRATGTGLGLALGTHVPVVHLPEQPDTARVFTARHRRAAYIGLSIGGTLFLGTAVLVVLTR